MIEIKEAPFIGYLSVTLNRVNYGSNLFLLKKMQLKLFNAYCDVSGPVFRRKVNKQGNKHMTTRSKVQLKKKAPTK